MSKFVHAIIIGCKKEVLLIRYLVIPIGKDKIAKREWAPLIDNMERRLESWKGRTLSQGGRLIMANSVLSVMPIFLMSI